jgi:short-subunit dehydrogenase
MNKFAVITGASSGIGLELARIAAGEGYDLLLAADTPFPDGSAGIDGVDRLLASARNRPIDLLCANAGHGLGHAFLEQPVEQWRHVIETNVTGTVYLLQSVLRQMTRRNAGKVLVTGSIAGVIPGSYQAVYNGTKAFVNSFAAALREELKDFDGVQITTLMPGATETEFFHRANMDDTPIGEMKKDDAADVARTGWDALMKGRDDVVHGLKNKLQAAAGHLLPEGVTAGLHAAQAKPKGDG